METLVAATYTSELTPYKDVSSHVQPVAPFQPETADEVLASFQWPTSRERDANDSGWKYTQVNPSVDFLDSYFSYGINGRKLIDGSGEYIGRKALGEQIKREVALGTLVTVLAYRDKDDGTGNITREWGHPIFEAPKIDYVPNAHPQTVFGLRAAPAQRSRKDRRRNGTIDSRPASNVGEQGPGRHRRTVNPRRFGHVLLDPVSLFDDSLIPVQN